MIDRIEFMEQARITILGTGTSCGVPQLGCNCPTCTSSDPRDKRLRTSVLVEVDDPLAADGITRILLDCGPDFRAQMLNAGFRRLDAIFLTHEHYDHVGGIDDIRPFSVFGDMTIYADNYCATHLIQRIPYCFTPKDRRYPGVPRIDLEEVKPGVLQQVNGVEVLPVMVYHGKLPIMAYRIGRFAYVTDMKTIDPSQERLLQGVTHMVVNGLRHETHPTHQTIDEAIAFADRLKVEEAYVVHMSHHVQPHEKESALMPPHRHLSYDGLTFNCMI